MADDAIAYDCRIEGEDLVPGYREREDGEVEFLSEWRRIKIHMSDRSTKTDVYISLPLSDLPSARVGDKVQVALFLRPEAGDGE